MTMTKTIINLSNLNGVDIETLKAALTAQGIDATIQVKAQKVVDNLNYQDDTKAVAICKFNAEHKFNVNELDAETLKECKRTGLCPDCLEVMKQAAAIKQQVGLARTRRFTDNRPSADKPGYQIRQLFVDNIDNIDDKLLRELQDETFCKKEFKLRYPLLRNVTGLNDAEVKAARMDGKHPRFSPQTYQLKDRIFVMTNDLYERNLQPIQKFFAQFNK